ncbi:MAG: FecR domain-containing protein [Tannerellaceae bacterium]|jgi:ferric-dicitrate binding protein FerR (iron transport regulator)|nr:FecR domain-containing protein [Tannerellaceae bacterium]
MKEKNYISELITQYLLRRYGRETEEKVQRWLIDETHAAEKNRLLEIYWNTIPEGASRQTYASLAEVKARLGMEYAAPVATSRRLWLRIAAVLLPFALLTGSYFLLKNQPVKTDSVVNISVPYGERREIRLPDASTVFLNAGSSIQYPVSFSKEERLVRLSGEACFSVSKDVARPFIVETEHLSVEVLGTEFNVKAYPDENRTTATLNSGKIRVETKTAQSYILTPNRQLSYDTQSKHITIASVNAEDYSLWKEGRLIFDNMPLSEILSAVERKFDVSVRWDNAIDSANRYTVKFVRNENLDEVMKILEVTCGFASHVEGKVVRLTKN